MRKGIAIRTILLFLIGLVTAGIIIYYVYRTFTGSAMSQEECRSMAISWCTGCWNAMNAKGSVCAADDDWDDGGTTCEVGPTPSQKLQDCSEDYYTKVTKCEGEKDFCSNFIPL